MKVWVLIVQAGDETYVNVFDSEDKAKDYAVKWAQEVWDDDPDDYKIHDIERPEEYDDLESFDVVDWEHRILEEEVK